MFGFWEWMLGYWLGKEPRVLQCNLTGRLWQSYLRVIRLLQWKLSWTPYTAGASIPPTTWQLWQTSEGREMISTGISILHLAKSSMAETLAYSPARYETSQSNGTSPRMKSLSNGLSSPFVEILILGALLLKSIQKRRAHCCAPQSHLHQRSRIGWRVSTSAL